MKRSDDLTGTRFARRALAIVICAALTGCEGDGAGKARPTPKSVTWRAPGVVAMGRPAPAAASRPRVSARPEPRVAPKARVTPPRPAAMAAAAVDRSNRAQPPVGDPALAQQGRALLGAIARNRPALATSFFFPRKPFTPLKRAKDPDRYWQHIFALYERDISRWHRRRRDWTGATFHSLRPGTRPTWVKPGKEHNKIGYWRTYWSKLRYRHNKRLWTIYVHTMISWQGHWYVTHLQPPRRPRLRGTVPRLTARRRVVPRRRPRGTVPRRARPAPHRSR